MKVIILKLQMKREKARPHSVELAVCVYVPKFSELLRPDRIKKRC